MFLRKYNKDFLILFGGQTVSNIGDQIYLIALPWLVYELTQSSFDMGTISAINALPEIVFAIFMGVFIDRYNKKKIMLIACIIEFILIALIPILSYLNLLNIHHIYVIGFLYSSTTLVFLITYRSSIPILVGKSLLVKVNSLIQISLTLIKMIGPILAGILIANFGVVHALMIDSLTFLVLLISITLIKIPRLKVSDDAKTSIKQDIKDGFKYTFGSKELRFINWLVLVVNIGMSVGLSLMVFYLRGENNLLAKEVGFVYSIAGTVAFLMTIMAPYISKVIRDLQAISLSCCVSGIGLILMPFMDGVVLVGISLGLVTGGGTLATIYINSTLQSMVPVEYLGRVFATAQMTSRISVPVALMIGGWSSATIFGIDGVFKVSGSIILLSALLSGFSLRRKKEELDVSI